MASRGPVLVAIVLFPNIRDSVADSLGVRRFPSPLPLVTSYLTYLD
jgi:hypothetical protein